MSARARLIGPLAGFLFVVLSVVSAVLIFSDSPGGSDFSDQEIVSWFTDHNDRIAGGAFLWVPAALLFLVFLASLRRRLVAGTSSETGLAGVALAGGVGFVVLVSVGHGLVGGMASALDYAKPFTVDPTDARLISVLTFWMDLYSLIPAAAMVGAVAVAVRRTLVLPRWVWIVSAIATVLIVASMFAGPLGLIVVLVWTLVISVALWLTPAAVEPRPVA